jgi:hypothetical protein
LLGSIDGTSESLGWKEIEGAAEGLRDFVGGEVGASDG